MESIHIRGLDMTTTRQEVTVELKKVLGKLSEAEVKMREFRPNAGGTQVMTISLERSKARQLLEVPFLLVGLSRARLDKRINVPRCRRCGSTVIRRTAAMTRIEGTSASDVAKKDTGQRNARPKQQQVAAPSGGRFRN